jgi:hypothetical protein
MKFKAGLEEDAKPPKAVKPVAERKSVHPGLLRYAKSLECQRCEVFLDWFAFGLNGSLSAALCQCGFWVLDARLEVRWIRFASAPTLYGAGPLYAPLEKKEEEAK